MLHRKVLLFVDLSPGITLLEDLQGVFASGDDSHEVARRKSEGQKENKSTCRLIRSEERRVSSTAPPTGRT
jgi:hypothetical protein